MKNKYFDLTTLYGATIFLVLLVAIIFKLLEIGNERRIVLIIAITMGFTILVPLVYQYEYKSHYFRRDLKLKEDDQKKRMKQERVLCVLFYFMFMYIPWFLYKHQ